MEFINNIQKIPDELQNTIKDFTLFRPKTKNELETAIKLLYSNRRLTSDEALKKYGDISLWDTSSIEDMSEF